MNSLTRKYVTRSASARVNCYSRLVFILFKKHKHPPYTRYEEQRQSHQKMENINVFPTVIASKLQNLRKSYVWTVVFFFDNQKSFIHSIRDNS